MAEVKKGWGIGYGTEGTPKPYTNRNDEIARTQTVIQNRINAGMDTTAQLAHYKNLTGADYNLPQAPAAPTTPAAPAAPTTPAAPAAPAFDQAAYLKQQQDGVNSIYDQMKQAQLAAAQAARQKAVNEINYQKSLVAPQYRASRNQADVVNSQGAQKLKELMAANGLQASGENVTASIGLQSARQKSLNDLNLQEQQTMNDYDRQITDINDPSNDLSMIADIEARRAQALYDASVRADETGYSRSRDALSDSRYDKEWDYQTKMDAFQNALNEAQVTGKYNGQDTYQAIRDKVSDSQWKDSFDYQKGRDTVSDSQWKDSFNYQKDRDKVSDSQWNKTFDYQKGRDDMADNQWRQELLWQKKQFASDNEWRKYTFSHMSATDQKQMEINEKQFGEDMAWKMYELQYNGNISLANNQAQIDYFKNASVSDSGYSNNYKTQAAGNSSGLKSFKTNLSAAVKKGVPSSWAADLTELVGRESSWNPSAKNPSSTAYGYAQFLKSTRATYEKKTGLNYSDPVNQIVMMAAYVKDRYGTPAKALQFWDKNKWY